MIRQLKHLLIPCYQRVATLRGGRTFERADGRPTAFLLLTPDYGNIGDLAIGVAQEKYLAHRLPGYDIISIPLADTYAWLRSLKQRTRRGDLVFLVGGGSTGDLYPRAHFGRVFVIRYLRRLPIISFPQSIIYSSETAKRTFGRRERAAFTRHSALRLFVRERTSMRIMSEVFDGKIGFAPDIVFSMTDLVDRDQERSHALVVLRRDGERALSRGDHQAIFAAAETVTDSVVARDHEVRYDRHADASPAKAVNELIDQYRQAQVVITDRLHGMIFAAVAGTPCVVLANSNHKIAETYRDWLRDTCPFVQFAEDLDSVSLRHVIEQAMSAGRAGARAPALDFTQLDAAVAEFALRAG